MTRATIHTVLARDVATHVPLPGGTVGPRRAKAAPWCESYDSSSGKRDMRPRGRASCIARCCQTKSCELHVRLYETGTAQHDTTRTNLHHTTCTERLKGAVPSRGQEPCGSVPPSRFEECNFFRTPGSSEETRDLVFFFLFSTCGTKVKWPQVIDGVNGNTTTPHTHHKIEQETLPNEPRITSS
jgi:hypothetical protein